MRMQNRGCVAVSERTAQESETRDRKTMYPGLSLGVKNAASVFTSVLEGWWLSFGVLPLFSTLCGLYKEKWPFFGPFLLPCCVEGGERG